MFDHLECNMSNLLLFKMRASPTRMAVIKKKKKTSIGHDLEKSEPSYTAGGNINGVATVEIS